jgi:hypothetical protein
MYKASKQGIQLKATLADGNNQIYDIILAPYQT